MAYSTRQYTHQQPQHHWAQQQQHQQQPSSQYSHHQQWLPQSNSSSYASPSQRANVHNFDPSTPPDARQPPSMYQQQQSYYPSARTEPSSGPHTPVFDGKISPPASTSRTPQLIKCSTCMSLVPLLDLSEHICKPAPPQNEDSHLPNARKANNAGTGLRINIVQAVEAQYRGTTLAGHHNTGSSGLSPIDQRTPSSSASSPLSAHSGPAQYSSHGGRLSPFAGNGGYASHDTNDPYAAPLHSAPLPSSGEDDTMQIQQSMPRSFSSKSALAKIADQSSPTRGLASHLRANIDGSSPTSASPTSQPGSGNSAKFFQRYDQIYGGGPPPASSGMTFTHSAPAAQRHESEATPDGDVGSHELRSTWSTQSSASPAKPTRAALPHQTSDELSRGQQAYNRFGRSDTYREREQQRHNRMQSAESSENSSDSPSSSSYSHDNPRSRQDTANASATMGFLDSATPDTSPEIPDAPMFNRRQDEAKVAVDAAMRNVQQRDNRRRHDQPSIELPEMSPTADATSCGISASFSERRSEHRDSQAAVTDDFLDSYPTPQATFTGSFGALVVDDSDTPFDRPPAGQNSLDRPAAPSRKRSNAMLHSTATQQAPQDDDTPRVAQQAAFPGDMQTTAGASGLEACLDDLMKEMNRDTYCDTTSAPRPRGEVKAKTQVPLGIAGQLRRKLTNPKAGHADADHASDSLAAARMQLAPSPILGSKAFDRSERTPSPLLSSTSLPSIDPTSKPRALFPEASQLRSDRQATTDAASSKSSITCAACRKAIARGAHKQRKGDQTFCQACYADLYLPKCQRCSVAIEGRAVGSSDGKLKGKYHPDCFTCLDCSAGFPTGDFYVFGQNPYCARHYHALNGTLCANSACTLEGIEGPCVSLVGEENGSGGRYHPDCFLCSEPSCNMLLDQWHFILGGLPYCERHAREVEDREQAAASFAPSSEAPAVYTPLEYDSQDGYFPPYDQRPAPPQLPYQQHEPSYTPRSISPVQHMPPNGTSISALRKNSTTPAYGASRPRHDGRQQQLTSYQQWQQQQQQPRPIYAQKTHGYPTPPSAGPGLNTLRRAEKRRTVIQRI